MCGHGPFPATTIEMTGHIENWIAQSSALQVEGWIKEKLERTRSTDASSKKTEIGPHRSELKVLHIGKNQPAELCSTGEQKTRH